MKSSLEHGNWKAVHVLAGSIIEAVLADCLIAYKHKHTHSEEAVLKMDLAGLVAESSATARMMRMRLSLLRAFRTTPGFLADLSGATGVSRAQLACDNRRVPW